MDNLNTVINFLSAYIKPGDGELEQILQRIHASSYAKNEQIQKQGGISRSVALVIKGAVRSYYTDEKGTEHTVNFVFENQPLVVFDSFANQTPSGTASMAIEATEVIWTSHGEFFGFMEVFPKYEAMIRSIIGQNLILEGEHSKLLRINPSRERYEALCKARPELINRVPLKYIASYIGMTLETLSRVRAGKL